MAATSLSARVYAVEKGFSAVATGLIGLVVVVLTWRIIPLWYHVVFTLMLIPVTIVGGRLKSFG